MIHSWGYFEMDFADQPDFTNTSSYVPNGFIELVFLNGLQVYEQIKGQSIHKMPQSFVWGQTKWGNRIVTAGKGTWFEIKLYPWAFNLLFDHTTLSIPAGGTALVDLNPAYEKLVEEITLAPNSSASLRRFETFALQQLEKKDPLQAFFMQAYQLIYTSHGSIKIEDICQRLQVSRQYLHQYFKEKVGLSPKAYAKIIRLRHTVDNIYQNQDQSLTQVSLDAGYFDQAHFISDFKSILGQTPKSFFKQKQFIYWDL